MESNKTSSRGDSTSPTNQKSKDDVKKGSDGGVEVPREKTVVKKTLKETLAAANAPNWNGPMQDRNMSATNGDPFKQGSKKSGHKSTLSGNATTFLPGTNVAPISFLNHGSTADVAPKEPVIVSSDMGRTPSKNATAGNQAKTPGTQQPIGTRTGKPSPTRKHGNFTTDFSRPGANPSGGHYLKITNVNKQDVHQTLEMIYKQLGWANKIRGTHALDAFDSKQLSLYVSFDDILDAADAVHQIQKVNTTWSAQHISQLEYANSQMASNSGTQEATAFHDGQLVFQAHYTGPAGAFSANCERLFGVVQGFALAFGGLVAFQQLETDEADYRFAFHAEYNKISVAHHVLNKVVDMDPQIIGDCWVVYTERLTRFTDPSTEAMEARFPNGVRMGDMVMKTPHKLKHDGGMGQFASPTGRTSWRVDANGAEMPTKPLKPLPKCHPAPAGMAITPFSHRHSAPVVPYTPASQNGIDVDPRSASWAPVTSTRFIHVNTPGTKSRRPIDISGLPQHVAVAKIMKGEDVRTTVMLRNLPNSLGFLELKEILDTVSFGKYDFSYLRIDFSNNCNVGYGFVNFTVPDHIVEFINYWVGRPWYPSAPHTKKWGPRIAEVSYATIQGLDCLIEKFRNSSVMDEYPGFRPKLWYTKENAQTGDMVGSEMAFPRPNNHSKHQRSRDNATHVGLYASNKKKYGYQSGSNRRSQYDRGTTAQMQEDAWYYQNQYPMSPTHGNYGAYGYVGGYDDGNYTHTAPQMPMFQPPPNAPVFYDINGVQITGSPYNVAPYNPGNVFMNGQGNQSWVPPPGCVSGFDPYQPSYPTMPPPPVQFGYAPMGHYPAPQHAIGFSNVAVPSGFNGQAAVHTHNGYPAAGGPNGFNGQGAVHNHNGYPGAAGPNGFNGHAGGHNRNGNRAAAGPSGTNGKSAPRPKEHWPDDKPRTVEAMLRQVAINKAEIAAEEAAEKAAAENVQGPISGHTNVNNPHRVHKTMRVEQNGGVDHANPARFENGVNAKGGAAADGNTFHPRS